MCASKVHGITTSRASRVHDGARVESIATLWINPCAAPADSTTLWLCGQSAKRHQNGTLIRFWCRSEQEPTVGYWSRQLQGWVSYTEVVPLVRHDVLGWEPVDEREVRGRLSSGVGGVRSRRSGYRGSSLAAMPVALSEYRIRYISATCCSALC